MGRLRAVLASQNAHKLEELRTALAGWELELLDAGSFPSEDGDTYYENALAKARFNAPPKYSPPCSAVGVSERLY